MTLLARLKAAAGPEVPGLLAFLAVVVVIFGLTADRFLSLANFGSIAYQLPELGLLTLAMLIPIISWRLQPGDHLHRQHGRPDLAWVLNQNGGPEAGVWPFVYGSVLALGVGATAGAVMGAVIAYIGAHPILVSLAMMIFLRGLGEFLTRGGDISGFPDYLAFLGHGAIFGIPVPLILFLACAVLWHILLTRTRHGFAARMIGSNLGHRLFRRACEADAGADLHAFRRDVRHRRHPDAGPLQLGPRRPWRGAAAGHRAGLLSGGRRPLRRLRPRRPGGGGACGAAGAVLGAEPAGGEPAPFHRRLGPVPDWRDDPALGRGQTERPKTEEGIAMEGFGVHTSMWTMNWDRAGAERTIPAAAEYKMDFIEIALLNAPAVDAAHTRALLEKHNMRAVASLGLPQQNWASVNPEGAIAHLVQAMDVAAAMGCEALSGVTYGGIGERTGCRRPKPNTTTSPAPWRRRRNTRKSWGSPSGSSR
jgi:hypothetical protein